SWWRRRAACSRASGSRSEAVSFESAVAAARRAAAARPSLPVELPDALSRLTRAVLAEALAAPRAAPGPTEARHLPLAAAWRNKQSGLNVSESGTGTVAAAMDAVAALAPDAFAAYLRAAAASVVDILRGEIAPLEPYLATEAPRFLYERSPVARWMNGVL